MCVDASFDHRPILQACDKMEVYREGAGSDECLHEGGSVWLVLKLIK